MTDLTRISTRTCTGSCRTSLRGISHKLFGFSPDLLKRTCARSCKHLLEDVSQILTRFSQKDLYKTFTSLREMHMDMSQAIYSKTAASLRNGNAHGHVTRAMLLKNLQEKCRGPSSRRTVAQACAIEMHMEMSLRIILYVIVYEQEKCRSPRSRRTA